MYDLKKEPHADFSVLFSRKAPRFPSFPARSLWRGLELVPVKAPHRGPIPPRAPASLRAHVRSPQASVVCQERGTRLRRGGVPRAVRPWLPTSESADADINRQIRVHLSVHKRVHVCPLLSLLFTAVSLNSNVYVEAENT